MHWGFKYKDFQYDWWFDECNTNPCNFEDIALSN